MHTVPVSLFYAYLGRTATPRHAVRMARRAGDLGFRVVLTRRVNCGTLILNSGDRFARFRMCVVRMHACMRVCVCLVSMDVLYACWFACSLHMRIGSMYGPATHVHATHLCYAHASMHRGCAMRMHPRMLYACPTAALEFMHATASAHAHAFDKVTEQINASALFVCIACMHCALKLSDRNACIAHTVCTCGMHTKASRACYIATHAVHSIHTACLVLSLHSMHHHPMHACLLASICIYYIRIGIPALH